MPMPQQLSQVAVLRIRHPDPRETVFDHQPQQQLRILPIRLLLAHPLGADLSGIPNPQFELQLAQQALEPTRVPAGFHAHPHTLPFEPGVELLGFLTVRQPPLPQLTALGVDKRNLLETRMIVTAYNQHVRLLSSEPFGGLRFQSLLGPGSRHCYRITTLTIVGVYASGEYGNRSARLSSEGNRVEWRPPGTCGAGLGDGRK